MRKFRLLVLVAAVIGPAVVPAAGVIAALGPARPGLVEVRIDAVVTDTRGRVVTDLAPADFEIVEDGVPRQIDSVRFMTATGAPTTGEVLPDIESGEDEKAEAARDGARLFAIFLDEYHISAGEATQRARAALTAFLDTHLGARDLVLVLKPLDSLVNMRLTRDRAAIARALAAFAGRKGDYTPRTQFERDFMAQDPARIDAARAQIAASALSAMAEHLGTLQSGRKTIIAVTEGFSRPVRRRGEAALPSLDVVIRSANRSGVSIYPLDPRALIPGDSPADAVAGTASRPTDTIEPPELSTNLQALATGTGGEAILTRADVTAALNRIVRDASGYYLLAFRPASSEETGRFRPVSVRVTRPSVTLRTRPGYWEPFPDPMAGVARAEAFAPVIGPANTSSLIRSWFGFARAEGGLTRVQYVWEPAPAFLTGDRSRASAPARTILSAFDSRGNVLVESVVAPVGAASLHFDLEPGIVRLWIRVEDASARLIDTDVRTLTVESLGNPINFGTPQVYRARNEAEFRELSANIDAVPAVTRQFSRTDRLLVRVPIYSATAVRVTAILANAAGSAKRPLDVKAGPDPRARSLDFPLTLLVSGEYRIVLRATDDDAHAEETIAFRVTP